MMRRAMTPMNRLGRCFAQAAERRISFAAIEQVNPSSITMSLPVNSHLEKVDLPIMWMRWNCECPMCKQSSGQKTLTPSEWPQKPQFENVWVEDGYVRYQIEGEEHVGADCKLLETHENRHDEFRGRYISPQGSLCNLSLYVMWFKVISVQ